jgi:hypothetical protein
MPNKEMSCGEGQAMGRGKVSTSAHHQVTDMNWFKQRGGDVCIATPSRFNLVRV